MNRLILDNQAYAFTAVAVLGRFDRESGEQKSAQDGRPEWVVQTLVQHSNGAKPETIEVVIAGDEPKVSPLTAVQFEGLAGRPWLFEGRAGVSFRAESVRPANAKTNGQKPAVEPAPVGG